MPTASHTPSERTGGTGLMDSEPNPTQVVIPAQKTGQPFSR